MKAKGRLTRLQPCYVYLGNRVVTYEISSTQVLKAGGDELMANKVPGFQRWVWVVVGEAGSP